MGRGILKGDEVDAAVTWGGHGRSGIFGVSLEVFGEDDLAWRTRGIGEHAHHAWGRRTARVITTGIVLLAVVVVMMIRGFTVSEVKDPVNAVDSIPSKDPVIAVGFVSLKGCRFFLLLLKLCRFQIYEAVWFWVWSWWNPMVRAKSSASRWRNRYFWNNILSKINKGGYCKSTTNQVSYCKCRSLRSQWDIFRWTACFPSIRLEFLLRKGCQQPASSTVCFPAKIWARSWCCQWGKTPWSHHQSKGEFRQPSPKMNGDLCWKIPRPTATRSPWEKKRNLDSSILVSCQSVH